MSWLFTLQGDENDEHAKGFVLIIYFQLVSNLFIFFFVSSSSKKIFFNTVFRYILFR